MLTTTAPALSFPVTRSSTPTAEGDREAILSNPGFGRHFSDHMAVAFWTPDEGWHDGRVQPYAPLTVDPAAAVFHYGQEIFEGMKAYRHGDDSVWLFRPEANAARFASSADRLALPALSESDFLASLQTLVATDRAWVPSTDESSLYVRPFMIASDVFLGVRPAKHVTYMVIASPVGAYFESGPAPVSIWLSRHYTRAAPGGTGTAKCGGNYAASLSAQEQASANGCAQVCFLDAVEGRWVEELGGMNLFFVLADSTLVTPALSGTILDGITRKSIMALAREAGHDVVERRVSVDEWFEGVTSGQITEVFACGTAAVVTPLGSLRDGDRELVIGDGNTAGEATLDLRRRLIDIQYGRADDIHGWMTKVG